MSWMKVWHRLRNNAVRVWCFYGMKTCQDAQRDPCKKTGVRKVKGSVLQAEEKVHAKSWRWSCRACCREMPAVARTKGKASEPWLFCCSITKLCPTLGDPHGLQHTGLPSILFICAAAKSLQSYPTLCDPIDGSPPGSPIPGILQARTLEWLAISFSSAWKWKVKVKSLSHVQLFETPWTAAYQAPPSMGFFQARVLEWVAIAFSENE